MSGVVIVKYRRAPTTLLYTLGSEEAFPKDARQFGVGIDLASFKLVRTKDHECVCVVISASV